MDYRTAVMRRRAVVLAGLLLVYLSSTAATCGNKKPQILVANTGLAVSQAIGRIQVSVKQLTDGGVIPPQAALTSQQKLLQINTALQPLPDILRAIDAATNPGDKAANVEQAIRLLTNVGGELSVAIAGVPATQLTEPLIGLVRAAATTVTTTMLEIAKLRPANAPPAPAAPGVGGL